MRLQGGGAVAWDIWGVGISVGVLIGSRRAAARGLPGSGVARYLGGRRGACGDACATSWSARVTARGATWSARARAKRCAGGAALSPCRARTARRARAQRCAGGAALAPCRRAWFHALACRTLAFFSLFRAVVYFLFLGGGGRVFVTFLLYGRIMFVSLFVCRNKPAGLIYLSFDVANALPFTYPMSVGSRLNPVSYLSKCAVDTGVVRRGLWTCPMRLKLSGP